MSTTREGDLGRTRGVGSGYRSGAFAATYGHEGSPIELPLSGGWLVRRRIPNGRGAFDAVSCYPLLDCADWAGLPADLSALEGVVSVTAITDPLADAEDEVLRAAFPDLLRPYKQHLVVELAAYGLDQLSGHHRRNVSRGRRTCAVSRVDPAVSAADDWVGLYAQLVARHRVIGRADLPDEALRAQLEVPGAMAWRADVSGELAGIVVWMQSGARAYYHLGAYSTVGYRSRAAYALFDVALGELAGIASLAVLGAGAGVEASGVDDGLVRFKRGWGVVEHVAHLGGRVVDADAYARLTGPRDGYFPAYRAPVRPRAAKP